MHPERLQAQFETYRLPQPPDPPIAPGSFMCFPAALLPMMPFDLWQAQQWVYQLAFERAWAVARPSLLERDLLAVWN